MLLCTQTNWRQIEQLIIQLILVKYRQSFNFALFFVPADNWWCLVDGSVFTRMVDMYKSIVVFMLMGGKTLLVPVFYENYFVATLRLLEKLHKVHTKVTCCSCKQGINTALFPSTIRGGNVMFFLVKLFLVAVKMICTLPFPGVEAGVCSTLPGQPKGPPCGVQPLLYP